MKQAVVVGASQGLGLYVATRLVKEGWTVLGTGRRPFAEAAAGSGFDYLRADLSLPGAVEAIGRELVTRAPDLILYNAASYGERDPGVPPQEAMEAVFRVNAVAPYRLLLGYLSLLPPQARCSCVVVNSDSIYHANRHSGVYAASKAALRVLTTALASACRSSNASVSTLLLGPLADPRKVEELRGLAERRGVSEEEITRVFLGRSNPALVVDALIDFEACFQSVLSMSGLGRAANGMLCKLDGGSSGSLV